MDLRKKNIPSILFVAQSQTTGGVVRVLSDILTLWPEDDSRRLVILYNEGHGGKETFKQLSKINSRIETEEIPLWDYGLKIKKIAVRNKLRHFFFKIIYKFFNFFLFWRKLLYFYKKCIEENVKAVFSHNGGYPGGDFNRVVLISAKLAGVNKKYMIVHNLAMPVKWWRCFLDYLSDKVVNWAADKIIVVSEACGKALSGERYFSKPLTVIYNGINLEPQEVAWGLNNKQIESFNQIAFVGELVNRKGIHILMRAVSDLKCNYVLDLFGTGDKEYIDKLICLTKKLGIENNVVFHGFDPDVRAKLQYIDMLVLPSLEYESFGMVILEAMYWKKPVIVSDTGGMKEIVVDGITGLVVPAGDSDALKNAIEKLLINKTMAVQMGINGYKRLYDKFNAAKMIAAYYHKAKQ